MDLIWLAAPSPAMRLWDDPAEPAWRINAAAQHWGEARGFAADTWAALARELGARQRASCGASGVLAAIDLRWESVPLPHGWLIWFSTCEAPPATDDEPPSTFWRNPAEKLALVQEFSAIGLFERNLRTGEARWDAQLFQLFGFELGMRAPTFGEAIERIHPDDRERFRASHERFVREGGRHGMRYRVQRPDGTTLHLQSIVEVRRDAQGRPLTMIGAISNESADAQQMRAQAAITADLERALRLARVSVWRVDNATRRIHFNDVGYELAGIAPRAEGLDIDELRARAHPDDGPALVAAADDALTGGKVIDVEARYLRRGGGLMHVLTRRVAERDEHGRVSGLIGIALDRTESEGQRELADQAEQGRLLALRASRDKSELLARISHELRTPLNAVLGFAQLIEYDGAAVPMAEQLDRVARIRRAGEHLLALVDDVLDLTAIEAGTLPVVMEPVAVDAVFGDVAQWLAAQAGEAGVGLHVAPSGCRVRADARRLRQVVSNLVGNAIKFNRRGGNVWLTACTDASTGRCVIAVRDDGPGLATPQHARLFEAFNRPGAGHDGHPGAGLGLSIVRRLAEFMEGQVEVSSAAGAGCEFRVVLQAIDAEAAPAETAPMPREVPPLSVLYVEDNPVNVILVEEVIALRDGVVLRCAEDGVSGVAAALEHRPDVVLVDMQLPDIDGFEVLRRLRAEACLAGQVRIALSANSLAEDMARARAAGFDDYWTKPIDFKRFLAALDALVQRLRPGAAAH